MKNTTSLLFLMAGLSSGTAAVSQVELSTKVCSFDGVIQLYFVATNADQATLIGRPEATVLKSDGLVTFVTAQDVIQIGESQATMLVNGRAFSGQCNDASMPVSDLLQWLEAHDGAVALPRIDYSTQALIEEAREGQLALAADLSAAQAEAAAAAAQIEAQEATIRTMRREAAQLEGVLESSVEPLEAVDRELRRAMTQALRDAGVATDVAGPLISRMQAGEGLGSPTFVDLVEEVMRAIAAD